MFFLYFVSNICYAPLDDLKTVYFVDDLVLNLKSETYLGSMTTRPWLLHFPLVEKCISLMTLQKIAFMKWGKNESRFPAPQGFLVRCSEPRPFEQV